jgi:O-antigen/teichoic acid export membrane protein
MFEKLGSLFFKNTGIKQTILKNTFWLAFAEIIARISGLIIVIYIARVIGALEYGKFTFALAFASIISIISDLGIVDISTRDLSQSKENEKKIIDVFSLGLLLCFITLIISLMGSFFITSDQNIRSMIIVLTLFVLTNSIFAIVFSFLRARQRMEYEAFVKILQAVSTAVIIFSIIFFKPSALSLSYGYFIANFLVLFPVLIYFNARAHKLSFKFSKDIFKILKISWPLSFGFMIGWVYIYIDSVMLGYFNLISENGWYNAASKIAIATIIPANLIIRSFYPTLSNLFVSSKEKLQKAWDYLTETMIVLAIPIVIGGIALAPKIISTLYGDNFAPSVFVLQLLMIVIGLSLINYPYAIMLIIANQQKKNFWVMFGGACLNILLNFIFIPVYGFYGCIVATIISSILVFISTVILYKRFTQIFSFDFKLFKVSLISIASVIFMYFIVSMPKIYSLNVFIVCGIGVIAYFLPLIILYKTFFPQRKFSILSDSNI